MLLSGSQGNYIRGQRYAELLSIHFCCSELPVQDIVEVSAIPIGYCPDSIFDREMFDCIFDSLHSGSSWL